MNPECNCLLKKEEKKEEKKISRKDQGNLFDVILLFFVENLNLILIIKF